MERFERIAIVGFLILGLAIVKSMTTAGFLVKKNIRKRNK